jgi:hypothetical protein
VGVNAQGVGKGSGGGTASFAAFLKQDALTPIPDPAPLEGEGGARSDRAEGLPADATSPFHARHPRA